MVELLISSNIARYAEFRAVTRVATCMDGKLSQVPCSRSDVFANKTVSLIEKRTLMQLLTSCMDQGADSAEFNGELCISYDCNHSWLQLNISSHCWLEMH